MQPEHRSNARGASWGEATHRLPSPVGPSERPLTSAKKISRASLGPLERSPESWVSILLTLLVSLVVCVAVAYHAYELFVILYDEYAKGPLLVEFRGEQIELSYYSKAFFSKLFFL